MPVVIDGSVVGSVAQLSGGVQIGNLVIEKPIGTIDGTNGVFTLSKQPAIVGEVVLFRKFLVSKGVSNDFQVSGQTITFNSGGQPSIGDSLVVMYGVV